MTDYLKYDTLIQWHTLAQSQLQLFSEMEYTYSASDEIKWPEIYMTPSYNTTDVTALRVFGNCDQPEEALAYLNEPQQS